MNLVFNPNSTSFTCTMLVNDEIINNSVPFYPEKCIDHRGFNLFLYIRQNNYDLNDFKFQVMEFGEIMRGYNYMLNPVYLKQAVNNFKTRY